MTLPAAVIVVYGHPAPQGSKSGHAVQKDGAYTGRVVMHESSKHVRPWRQDVVAAAREQVPSWTARGMLDGPLAASMVFTFTRPASHYGTGRNAARLRPSAPSAHAVYPDLSKLIRSTEDALTTAGVWADDARVAEYRRAAKVFAGEDPDALDSPGAVIMIWRLGTGPAALEEGLTVGTQT